MKKLLSRLIWLPLGFAVVVFLVANRAPVAVSFDPFDTENPLIATPELPLWVWLMAMLLIGFFLGAASMWMSAGKSRRQARDDKRALKKAERDLETAAAAASAPAADSDNLPVLKAS